MVNGVRYITTILFIFIFSLKVSALSDKVLIVSSYGTDYKWSNVIIDKINKEVAKKHPGIEINVEFLSSEFIENPCTWGDKMDILLSNYKKNKPLAIILISDEAWMAYQDANATYFNGVPLILCAVKPHTIRTADFVAKHDSLSLSHFTPTLDVMKKYNATGIIREMNVKGYLSLMDNLIKGLDQFVFITDKRFMEFTQDYFFNKNVKKFIL